jgi:AcrR family transcriptional regulator
MGRRAAPTSQRILDRGLDLVSRVGVSGVTLGVLASNVGMSKSGLFAHFRSREAVQLALLQQMARVANTVVVTPAMAKPSGLPRLIALVERWFGWTTRAGLSGGCPIAAALFELDDLDGKVRDEVVAMEGRWRELLAQLTREAISRGELRRGLDVEQFVWELCGIYLSHHASRRFLKEPLADRRAMLAFGGLVQRSRPAPNAQATSPDHE